MTAPVPPVDLDQLAATLAAATPGPWGWNDMGLWNNGWTEVVAPHDYLRPADAAAIVAAVNAAPALIAELRDLRAKVAAVEALADEIETRARRNLDAARREPLLDLAKRHRSRGLGQDTDAKMLRAALNGGS